jgi:hypothetical protein
MPVLGRAILKAGCDTPAVAGDADLVASDVYRYPLVRQARWPLMVVC